MATRPAAPIRYIGGVPQTAYSLPRTRRTITSTGTATGTGSLKSYVSSTTALTGNEWNVVRAFWVLFGRAPERSSLAYWVSQPYSNNLANTIDGIVTATTGSRVLDLDPTAAVQRFYYNIFGKYESEDASGIGYWAARVASGDSLGYVADLIMSISASASGFHGDTYRNRILALESVARLQAAYSRDLSYQDSRSLGVASDGFLSTYEATMVKIHAILVLNTPPAAATAWADSWTAASLFAASRIPDGSPVRQVRNVVWYNRLGQAMLANIYLPASFEAASVGALRGILAVHGGGWRIGAPFQLDWFCTAMANDTVGTQHVVVAPTYRLTAYGYDTPNPQDDISDILALARFSTFLKVDVTQFGLFGESSGGHLCLLAGCVQPEWRVMAMYPPTDLRGTPAVSTDLQPYVNDYAPSVIDKRDASPAYRWPASSPATNFNLWHGDSDTFVPSSQSTSFQTVTGPVRTSVTIRTGEGHGFTPASKAALLVNAKSFFTAS
jgi:acetyl esterase/lipase